MNPGDRWGGYKIIRMLGRGAMGAVFLAENTETQKQIALKIVYKGPDPEDQEIIEAERLGAELQKRLSGVDRRVVNVNQYGEQNGDLFLEMEYIEGEDLSAIMSRGPLHYGFAAHITIELCEMLENLSTFTTTIGEKQFVGIVHGDLKPRNIRINPQNQVRVIDFGIAKALSHTRKSTMNVFASTAYCSPERLETQSIDSHSDLWSVGVLLYQMLAGNLPFDETTKERLERRIRAADPPAPLPATCPEQLACIVFKMLSRDPARRYQSATAMKDDLLRFRNMQPVVAEPLPAAVSGDATVRTGPVPSPPQQFPGFPPSMPPVPPSPISRTGAGEGTARTVPPKEPPIIWPPKNPKSRRNTMGCLIAASIVGIILIAIVSGQINFLRDADTLKSDLQTERITVSEGWTRYRALKQRAHLPFFLWGVQGALRKRLLASADETILDYRNNDEPVVFEPQWIEARNNLNLAMQLDPSDNLIKGRFRLCEGHIDRINGEPQYHKGASRPYKPANRKLLNSALAKFNDAADMLKKWPDPFLGLARLYILDLDDIEKGESALNQAAEYGRPRGKRETAMLADGYMKRADRFWTISQTPGNSPDQERDSLNKADDDYKHAQDLYETIRLFSDVERNRTLAIAGRQKVAARIKALQPSA